MTRALVAIYVWAAVCTALVVAQLPGGPRNFVERVVGVVVLGAVWPIVLIIHAATIENTCGEKKL